MSVLQKKQPHQRLMRWCLLCMCTGCLTGTSLRRFPYDHASNEQPVHTPFFVTDAGHTIKRQVYKSKDKAEGLSVGSRQTQAASRNLLCLASARCGPWQILSSRLNTTSLPYCPTPHSHPATSPAHVWARFNLALVRLFTMLYREHLINDTLRLMFLGFPFFFFVQHVEQIYWMFGKGGG